MNITEKFASLPEATQKLLLNIELQHDYETLFAMNAGKFILMDDLDEYVDKIDNDLILKQAKEICNYSGSEANYMFDAIFRNIDFTENDVMNIIDELSSNDKDVFYDNMRELLLNESDNDMHVVTLDDEYKMEILKKLYDRYTSWQLEEHVKHLF